MTKATVLPLALHLKTGITRGILSTIFMRWQVWLHLGKPLCFVVRRASTYLEPFAGQECTRRSFSCATCKLAPFLLRLRAPPPRPLRPRSRQRSLSGPAKSWCWPPPRSRRRQSATGSRSRIPKSPRGERISGCRLRGTVPKQVEEK